MGCFGGIGPPSRISKNYSRKKLPAIKLLWDPSFSKMNGKPLFRFRKVLFRKKRARERGRRLCEFMEVIN